MKKSCPSGSSVAQSLEISGRTACIIAPFASVATKNSLDLLATTVAGTKHDWQHRRSRFTHAAYESDWQGPRRHGDQPVEQSARSPNVLYWIVSTNVSTTMSRTLPMLSCRYQRTCGDMPV